jgi:hypothetical protein
VLLHLCPPTALRKSFKNNPLKVKFPCGLPIKRLIQNDRFKNNLLRLSTQQFDVHEYLIKQAPFTTMEERSKSTQPLPRLKPTFELRDLTDSATVSKKINDAINVYIINVSVITVGILHR